MLERLDDIDWALLTHAYGPADDVPGQIRDLARADDDVRIGAYQQLYASIVHQGSRYEATAYAAPFLLELLADEDVPDRPVLVEMLAVMAIGGDEAWLPGTFPVALMREQAHGGDAVRAAAPRPDHPDYDDESEYRYVEALSDEDQQRYYRHIELAVYDAVRAGVPLLRELLRAPDPALRIRAAYTLAWFPEDAADSVPALLAAATDAQDTAEQVRAAATALVAAGLLGHRPPDHLLAAPERVTRWAAAVATALVDGDDAPDAAVTELLGWASGAPRDQIPFLDGNLAGLAGLVLERLTGRHAGKVFAAWLRGIPTVSGSDALTMVASALRVAFPEPVPAGTAYGHLAEDQRRLLTVLARSPRAWMLGEHRFGNFSLLMSDYGLSGSREHLRAYVNGEVRSART
ncbi:HEAT repeat domain-containing protein [Catellatospora tritici]|uniref:HEAT repeat domain-containing protein n=1 Tax=Catellatospora tritici TaxID=2851566 RepID=UPI001C2CF85D|nr:HEAT repeat domain-containing protein [Catellatospora tritici]MBV1856550.1 HEAT repeat domain-containing protein [Catellatospora tritici]